MAGPRMTWGRVLGAIGSGQPLAKPQAFRCEPELISRISYDMTIQVLDRAVKILRIVARRGPSSLTEISREANLPVPTTARILDSLAENGIIRRLEGRKYHLGARLLPLPTGLEPFRKPLAP